MTKKQGDEPGPEGTATLPVVGIGGSAGSIEALLTFFFQPARGLRHGLRGRRAPLTEHVSMLASVLQRKSPIPVIEVTSPTKLRRNEAYLITPGKNLSLTDDFVQPVELIRPRGTPVDQ